MNGRSSAGVWSSCEAGEQVAKKSILQTGFCFSGAKAQFIFESLTARVSSCPDTCIDVDTVWVYRRGIRFGVFQGTKLGT
jgi:hypothetical protein